MSYYKYSDYLKNKYGEKVYKLPVSISATCPNRDGRKGVGGCIFCGEKGGGLENLPNTLSVKEQLRKNREYIGKRYGAQKYIAYFQNFTNTYVSLDDFENHLSDASQFFDIVEISIATRPDCITNEYLEILKKAKEKHNKEITIELGFQTANYHTLRKINRGHGIAEFIDAVLRIKEYKFEIGAHVILNLPWDNLLDTIETARILSSLKINHAKIHSLYVEKDTVLYDMYLNNEFEIISMSEYVERVVAFLENLDENIAIQRVASRAPSRDTIFCNWGRGWWKIMDAVEEKMFELELKQGDNLKDLHGIKYGK